MAPRRSPFSRDPAHRDQRRQLWTPNSLAHPRTHPRKTNAWRSSRSATASSSWTTRSASSSGSASSASAGVSASRPRSYAPCITHPGPVLCWAPAISCACTNYPITPAVDNFLSASPGPFGPGPSQKIRHLGDAALSGWGL